MGCWDLGVLCGVRSKRLSTMIDTVSTEQREANCIANNISIQKSFSVQRLPCIIDLVLSDMVNISSVWSIGKPWVCRVHLWERKEPMKTPEKQNKTKHSVFNTEIGTTSVCYKLHFAPSTRSSCIGMSYYYYNFFSLCEWSMLRKQCHLPVSIHYSTRKNETYPRNPNYS